VRQHELIDRMTKVAEVVVQEEERFLATVPFQEVVRLFGILSIRFVEQTVCQH